MKRVKNSFGGVHVEEPKGGAGGGGLRRSPITSSKRRHRGMAVSVIGNEGFAIMMWAIYFLQWILLIVSFVTLSIGNAHGRNVWRKILRAVSVTLIPSTVVAFDPKIPERIVQYCKDMYRWRVEEKRATSMHKSRAV